MGCGASSDAAAPLAIMPDAVAGGASAAGSGAHTRSPSGAAAAATAPTSSASSDAGAPAPSPRGASAAAASNGVDSHATQAPASTPRGPHHTTTRAASVPARNSMEIAAANAAAFAQGLPLPNAPPARVITDPRTAEGLRGALLPNFYRMQHSSGGGGGGGGGNPNTPGGALASKRGPISDATGSVDYDSSLDDTTAGGVSMWGGGGSDDEGELDDEEHEETMHMLHELTMLAVPQGKQSSQQHMQQQAGGYRGSVLSSDNGSDEQTTGARQRSSPTPSSNSTSTATTMTTATTTAGSQPQQQQKGGANAAQASTVPGAGSTPADGATSPSLSRKRMNQAGRRTAAGGGGGGTPSGGSHNAAPSAHLHLSDTLFHGFYAKRCITSVKKSMASSGLYLVYKDMFTSMDTTGCGSITKKDWAALMGKLGLPLESATSLSRIVGLGGGGGGGAGGATSDTHITLEQFAMVMALSMHGPYVRLLQTTSSQNRKQVFLGGEKFTRSKPNAAAPAAAPAPAATAAGAVAMVSVGSTGNWRREIAIPIFKRERVPFFNPAGAGAGGGAGAGAGAAASPTPSSPSHASSASPPPTTPDDGDLGDDDRWTAEAVILEALAKSQSHMMLFVVDARSRSIASMVEASEHIVSEKEVILVLLDVAAHSVIGAETVTPAEAKDLNRGRAYLADVAHRNAHSGVTVFKDVALACEYIVKRWHGAIVKPSLKYFQKPVILPMPHLMLPGPGAGVSLGGSQAGTAPVTPRPGSSVAGPGATPSPQVSPMVLARNALPPSITLTPSGSPSAGAALSPPGPAAASLSAGQHQSDSNMDAGSLSPQPAAAANLGVSGGGLLSARRASGTASARRGSHNAANAELTNAMASSPFGLSSPLSVMSSTVARRHSVGNKAGGANMFLLSAAAAAHSPFAAEAAQAGAGAKSASASASAAATPASVVSPAQTSATLSFPNPASPSSPAATTPAPAASPSSSPAASPAASAPHAFSVEDWPLHPAPSDFDRYIRSAHFAECGRIVFKHQVLLARRAALKVAQQAQQAQAAAGLGLPSSNARASPALLGVGGTGAQPPGLFRAPSSPLVAGKLLKHSGSSATLGSGDGAAATAGSSPIAGPMAMANTHAAVVVKPHPVHTTGLHIVTNSSPSASPLAPTGAGPVASTAVAAATAGRSVSDTVSPEDSRAAPSSVLVRVASTSVSEAQRMSLTFSAGDNNHLEHSSFGGGNGGGGSALGSPTQRGGASAGLGGFKSDTASTTPAGTRPPSTAGMHVNLVAPDGSSHPQTQAQLLAASSPPPPAAAPVSPLSPPLKEEDECVSTFALFTMLMRLHEIIQLSTGIHFLHPYPALVSESLEKSGERVGESLPFAEWKLIAERVMSNLRGVYETTAGYDESQTASRAESPHHTGATAAAAGAATAATASGVSNTAGTAATAAAGSSMDHRKADEMRSATTSNTGRVLPLSADPRRRSVSRFGTPRHTSMGLGLPSGSGADMGPPIAGGSAYPGSSASSMSPSQFIRQMGHSRRSGSDADALTAGGAGMLIHGGSSRNVAAGALGSPAPMHPNSRVIGLGAGASGTKDKPQSADKTNSAAVVARVRARLSAQQRAISNMTPGGVSASASSRHSPSLASSPLGGLAGLSGGGGGAGSGGDELIWAQTLHSGDLDKLAQSLASSVAHDAMVLREMLPSFSSMFKAVAESSGAQGDCISLTAVRALLANKLLLPSDSCDSLIKVLELARQSCWNAAKSAEEANQDLPGVAAVAAPAAGALPSTAFDPSALSEASFVSILAQSLHLASSPFFHFLNPRFNFLAQARAEKTGGGLPQVFLGGSCHPTTWRVDEAIPILSAAGVSCFNPQVDNWSQELVLVESLIKANCIAAGTPVALASGVSVPIEQVRAGDEVWTLGADSACAGVTRGAVLTDAMKMGSKACVELLLSDGRTLVCTPDHRIRTADGRWVQAGQLQVTRVLNTPGSSRGVKLQAAIQHGDKIAVGVQTPTVEAPSLAEQAWRLSRPDGTIIEAARTWSWQQLLAFSRILGYLLSDGGSMPLSTAGAKSSPRLFLGHDLDVLTVQADLELLLPGERLPSVQSPVDAHVPFVLPLPRKLARIASELGVASGGCVGVTSFPACLLSASCPVAVVREFLGGLFGGDGGSFAFTCGMGFAQTKLGSVARAQQQQWRDELFGLLARAGVPMADATLVLRQAPDAGQACAERLKVQHAQLDSALGDDTPLHPGTSYTLCFSLRMDQTPAFAASVGFRYCVHKQVRLSAATLDYTGAQFVLDQRSRLRALIKQLVPARDPTVPKPAHGWLAQAAAMALVQLSASESVHPLNAAWTIGLNSKHLKATASDDDLAMRATSESSSQADHSRWAAPLQRGSLELPLFSVTVVGRRDVGERAVYDLTVPTGQSFLAQGVLVHNCETLLFVIDCQTRAIASMIEASEYICSGRDVVLVVKNMPADASGSGSQAQVNNELLGPEQVRDLNRARSYVTDVAQRHGLDVFTNVALACEYIVTKRKEKEKKEEQYAAEVETFIASEEFVEKTFEEFYRCAPGGGVGGSGGDSGATVRLNAMQLLLACLHLEQDLRPLIPPQAAKHRQPQLSDVEVIMKQFGGANNNSSGGGGGGHSSARANNLELDDQQFLQFSRVLFRNVCAHVKL